MSLTIVNYYSRGYGDSITLMLLGRQQLQRGKRGVKTKLPGLLKTPGYYSQTNSQHFYLEKIKRKCTVVSAHRQNGFDYTTLDSNVKVISIVPDRPDILAKRILALDHWQEEHPVLSKLLHKLSFDEKVKYTQRTIESWTRQNILDSDLRIPMSDLYQLEKLNLGHSYSKKVIDDIYKDMKLYETDNDQ